MEAKDKRISDFTDDETIIYQRGYRHGSEAEREISFKAGQDSVFDSMPDNLPPLLGAAHRSGIKEVVSWLNKNAGLGSQTIEQLNEGMSFIPIRSDKWQAKLKEWGIDV